MKRRHGFVSNSSSSSFICEVCGTHDVGYEGPQDIGMVYCENHEHIFCRQHAVNKDKPSKSNAEWHDPLDFSNFDEAEDEGEAVPSIYCPICNMEVLTVNDMLAYLETKGITRQSVLEEVKAKYGDYESFYKAIHK